MKKWLKILLIGIAALSALIVVAIILVSPIAKNYVNRHGQDLIGREIKVSKLRVNPLLGRVKICDLTVYEEDGKTEFLSFDTLDVSVKLRKLITHKLYVRHITLAGPHVRVIQNGDKFNFSSIIDHFASDDEVDNDTTPSDWQLGFYNIRLSDGEVFYADNVRGSKWDLNNLNLRIPGVYFDGSENTDAGLALQLADGGVLRTEASLNMENNQFAVNLVLERFAISNLRAYLTDVLEVGKMDGLLNADISVKGNLSRILNTNISGKVALEDIDILDPNKKSLMAMDDLTVDVNRISLNDNFFDIKSIIINGLVTHYDIFPDGSNISRLIPDATETQTPDTQQHNADIIADSAQTDIHESKPLRFRLGSFALNDAQFTFNDFTLPEKFSFPVTKLNVKADNLSMDGDNKAKIMAHLPHGGSAIVIWRGRLDQWKQSQHLVLNIKNLRLVDLSPYAVAYLGYPFTDGTLSFTSENSVSFSQLEGRNNIDLFNPEVGDKRKDVDAELNIPIKAALYILKDKDGKVQLDVPVAGNIDSPEFSYMKLVWKTLGNLVVKVATSPFRSVSKAMGLSGELDFIAYDPLQTHFNSEQYSLLNKIVDVLQYDTNIVVTLVPNYNADASWKSQSLYLLKEEYYLSLHPAIANSDILPQAIIYDKVNAITIKDTGFVSFVRNKGIQSRKPSEKEVQRLAERLYPRDAAISSLEVVAAYRDANLKLFFHEQNGIPESRLHIGELDASAPRSGYVINSDVIGSENEEE